MSSEEKDTENLFSYGTLQTEAVQMATFGRKLAGRADALLGYRLTMVQTQDENFAASNGSQQRSVKFTGEAADFVEGALFTVTRKEIELADAYEPPDYGRVMAELRSGERAWVYLSVTQ